MAALFDITRVVDIERYSESARIIGAFKSALLAKGVLDSARVSEPMRSYNAQEQAAVARFLGSSSAT